MILSLPSEEVKFDENVNFKVRLISKIGYIFEVDSKHPDKTKGNISPILYRE